MTVPHNSETGTERERIQKVRNPVYFNLAIVIPSLFLLQDKVGSTITLMWKGKYIVAYREV